MSHFWVMCFFLMKLTSQIRLTGQVYGNFLQNVLPQLMEDVPLHISMNMNPIMPLIISRSPDLTSPDYFLWGFVKERVMAVASTTPDGMKGRKRRACTEITPQILAEVRRSFYQLINRCLQVEGHHFEHLL